MRLSGRYTNCRRCNTGKEAWWEFDAQGIPLCKVCADCADEALSRFRPEMLTGYDQSDVDEPIEPQE